MINDTLHLFVKFHEEGSGEFTGIKTMQEHLKVQDKKGKVVWGHFTSNPEKKGLWDQRMEIIHKQMKLGKEAFVFFCDRENQLLYVAKYIHSYKRAEIEQGHHIIEYIPEYYHHKVGTPMEYKENQLRSYAYIEVCKITEIDMNDANNIFMFTQSKSGKLQKVLDNKGMSSIIYVNIDDDLYNELEKKLDDKVNISILPKELEELEEIEYQHDVEKIKLEKIISFDDKPETADNKKKGKQGSKWNRSSEKAKRVIVFNNYKCEINDNHNYFISNITKENYVEAHHFIPMEFQDKFIPNSLDVEANIVSLCVVCHKRLHHGTFDDKYEIIKQLYVERIERLKKCGINISLEELLNLYK